MKFVTYSVRIRTQNIPRLNLEPKYRFNLNRFWKEQQARKARLDIYLDYITSIRFGVRGVDKRTTKYRKSREIN